MSGSPIVQAACLGRDRVCSAPPPAAAAAAPTATASTESAATASTVTASACPLEILGSFSAPGAGVVIPVSYTHLDVYKRQAQVRGFSVWP